MTGDANTPFTLLLNAASRGNTEAQEELWSTIYNELRDAAQAQLARERNGGDMQPTALVSEVYIRLFGRPPAEWQSRSYFWASVTEAIRRIIVDDARSRLSKKRGGGQIPGPLPQNLQGPDYDPATVLAVSDAMERLERESERAAKVVKLRYFAGLSIDETADVLGVSSGTVDAAWRLARAWMHRELRKGDSKIAVQEKRRQ